MPVLIAPGLNGDDGVTGHLAPTSESPPSRVVESGAAGTQLPRPHPPQLQSPDPRRPHLGAGVKYHLKMASYNPSVLNLLLNQVARCVLCSGKKTVKK